MRPPRPAVVGSTTGRKTRTSRFEGGKGRWRGSEMKLTMPLAAVLMVAGAPSVLARGADAACGKVTIAEMTWASAGVAAHVEDIILKEGYQPVD